MNTNNSKHVLIIDDDIDNRFFTEQLLQQIGFSVYGAANGTEALDMINDIPEYSIAFVDYQLPDINGIDLIPLLRNSCPTMFMIMATVRDDPELIDAAFES